MPKPYGQRSKPYTLPEPYRTYQIGFPLMISLHEVGYLGVPFEPMAKIELSHTRAHRSLP